MGKKCPNCGGQMVLRTATCGPHAGDRFWGCEQFPYCRGIRPFDENDSDNPPLGGAGAGTQVNTDNGVDWDRTLKELLRRGGVAGRD